MMPVAGPQDPLGLTYTGKLPEIAEAFRTTGTVCVERTLRILNKTRRSKLSEQDPDKLVDRVRSMGRTFSRNKGAAGDPSVGYASQMASLAGTLNQK